MSTIADRTAHRTLATPPREHGRGQIAEIGRHAVVTGVLVSAVILAIALRFIAFAPTSLRQVFWL